MTAIATSYESLLKVRKGAVGIVDVPEFGFVAVTGTGEPGGAEFTEAVQALYTTRPSRTSSPRWRGARSPWPTAIAAAGGGRR